MVLLLHITRLTFKRVNTFNKLVRFRTCGPPSANVRFHRALHAGTSFRCYIRVYIWADQNKEMSTTSEFLATPWVLLHLDLLRSTRLQNAKRETLHSDKLFNQTLLPLSKPLEKLRATKFHISRRRHYLATLRPRKNRAMSWSDDCQGRPRARTTVLLSTSSSFELLFGKENTI